MSFLKRKVTGTEKMIADFGTSGRSLISGVVPFTSLANCHFLWSTCAYWLQEGQDAKASTGTDFYRWRWSQ